MKLITSSPILLNLPSTPPPAMAAGDPQKQLLTLIRDFATERSQGERRVSDLKKRLPDLHAEADAANADLDAAKSSKETAELELKGCQVQLSLTDTSIVAQQTRVALLHEEVSKVRADLAVLKDEEWVQRDEFISTMSELNLKIRQFQEMTIHAFQKQNSANPPSDNEIVMGEMLDMENTLKDLEDSIESTNAQIYKLQEEYKKELQDRDEVHDELVHMKRKVLLVDAVMKETTQLQELARQTSELEKTYASLGEELQRRYTCPNCQFNNMGDMHGTSESDGKN